MSIDDVRCYLAQWGRDKDVQEFAVSSATVDLAAQAVGVEGARIAKTLSFRGAKELALGNLPVILVVCAGNVRIDNAKFKDKFGLKAKMLDQDEVLPGTGHGVGGVCPFAVTNPQALIYLDESLKRFATVFPACGSGNSAIELTCDELFTYSKATA